MESTESLTDDQETALQSLLKFIVSDKVAIVLYSAAGCGKSFLTRKIVDRTRNALRIVGVAPTHKARKVLDSFLNKDSFLKIQTMTVASLLNKLKTHSYIGTKKYVGGSDSKINNFDLFIVDEVSMIADEDFNTIMFFASQLNKKIIFVGDKYQIPNPSQKYKMNKDKTLSKKDSKAFELEDKIELTTIIRQNKKNPLIKVYSEIRDALIEEREPKIKRKNRVKEDTGVLFYNEISDWYSKISEWYLQLKPEEISKNRILAYTNESVKNHNTHIRKLFKRGDRPEPGELLMGYSNVGWPTMIIENSQDYYVIMNTRVENYSIKDEKVYSNLVGDHIILKETDTSVSTAVFIPDVENPNNRELLMELVKRAKKVNQKFSTTEDFKRYAKLKNKLVFMKNVYLYNDELMSDSEFRVNHPILFKSVDEVMTEKEDGERNIVESELTKRLKEKYPDLLETRYEDDKALSSIEKLADSFQVIEKDLDYGIATTVHKAQGSNYNNVFIDEADIDKLQDYYNHKLDSWVRASKERNQLKYVAYTRPKFMAHVYFRE